MEREFWFERWQAGQIGFHEGRPNGFLERRFVDELLENEEPVLLDVDSVVFQGEDPGGPHPEPLKLPFPVGPAEPECCGRPWLPLRGGKRRVDENSAVLRKRERRNEFDEPLYRQSIGRASRLLTQRQMRTSYNPR